MRVNSTTSRSGRGHLPRRQQSESELGFTIFELMISVAIVGVLATMATYGVGAYIRSAKVSEATGMIGLIQIAQEDYRSETSRYLDVSGGSFSNMHPTATPDDKKKSWTVVEDPAADSTEARFRELGVRSDSPVYYTYGCIAAGTGDALPDAFPTVDQGFDLPANAAEPFYFIWAAADLDGDGVNSYVVLHSLMNDFYIEAQGE